MIPYDKDEQIKNITRRHPLAFFLETLALIVLALLPYLFYYVYVMYSPDTATFVMQNMYVFLYCYAIWILGLWVLFALCWTDHYLDVWIITDGRIIDVEQYGLFRRRINTYRFDNIQDIVILNQNWHQKIFGYGSLQIITKGDSKKFLIGEVRHPQKVKDLIISLEKESLTKIQESVIILEDSTY